MRRWRSFGSAAPRRVLTITATTRVGRAADAVADASLPRPPPPVTDGFASRPASRPKHLRPDRPLPANTAWRVERHGPQWPSSTPSTRRKRGSTICTHQTIAPHARRWRRPHYTDKKPNFSNFGRRRNRGYRHPRIFAPERAAHEAVDSLGLGPSIGDRARSCSANQSLCANLRSCNPLSNPNRRSKLHNSPKSTRQTGNHMKVSTFCQIPLTATSKID